MGDLRISVVGKHNGFELWTGNAKDEEKTGLPVRSVWLRGPGRWGGNSMVLAVESEFRDQTAVFVSDHMRNFQDT